MIRVLIAEDDVVSRRALEVHLRKWGYAVETAENGLVAWELLKRDPTPRIALLDWMMPELDGVEVCRRIREMPVAPPTYVVMLTAKSTKEDIAHGLNAGADDYILKPFDPRELRARLQVGARFVELQQKQADYVRTLADREEQYRDLVENTHVWMCTHAFDGTLLSMNRCAYTALGLASAEEAVGKRLQEFLHTSSRELYLDYVTSILQQGHASGLMKVVSRTGEVKILEYRNSMRAGEKGQMIVRGYATDVTARVLAERELRESEARYRRLFDSNPYPMWVYALDGLNFLAVNDAAIIKYGYTRQEFLRLTLCDIRPPAEVPSLLEHTAKNSPSYQFSGVWKHRTKDGKVIEAEITSHEMEFDGRPARLVMAHDVSDRRELVLQLQQAQKMEAVGQLAGGVAHDFNNLLGVIIGYSEIILERDRVADPDRTQLHEVKKAGLRAASLTRQLLAFSRKQHLEPEVFSINQTIHDMQKMLGRLIGEDIELVTRLEEKLGTVKADPSQTEQVIMNLVVNARDAMPRGGRLTLETANVVLDEPYAAQHVGSVPGSYVMFAVSDNGVGMDQATQAHVFEPFFTTKGRDKGTGLGLSMVYGIVKQSGGYIWLESAPGKGTRFEVFLPRFDSANATAAPPGPTATLARGSETILLVEDEDGLRKLTAEFLRDSGYQVLEAAHPEEALQKSLKFDAPIDLIVTDIVMPVLNGFELTEKLASSRPDLPVLYMSGYPDDTIERNGGLPPHAVFMQKPIIPRDLSLKIREVLEQCRVPSTRIQ